MSKEEFKRRFLTVPMRGAGIPVGRKMNIGEFIVLVERTKDQLSDLPRRVDDLKKNMPDSSYGDSEPQYYVTVTKKAQIVMGPPSGR
jgi:hypothetical protein